MRSLDGIFSRTEPKGDQGNTVDYCLIDDELPTESGAESISDSRTNAVTSGIQFNIFSF